nr:COX assembly mitochondrial protein 2 homolog isoform X1 [Populus alba]
MHPPLTLHRHPMCVEIIEQFQKCHLDHPIAKFFGECTELKVKLDRCFREEKAVKRKANFEQSKKLKERLQALRKEAAEGSPEKSNFVKGQPRMKYKKPRLKAQPSLPTCLQSLQASFIQNCNKFNPN